MGFFSPSRAALTQRFVKKTTTKKTMLRSCHVEMEESNKSKGFLLQLNNHSDYPTVQDGNGQCYLHFEIMSYLPLSSGL